MGIVNLLSTGNYGETQRFQRLVFLTYSAFLYSAWNRNPHNSEIMGKLNSHSKGKLWENAIGFLRISCEVLIYAMPKTWKKWIHVVKKEYGKRKRFKVKGFLDFSLEAEIHAIPKIWEKWVSIVQEKYGKTQTLQFHGFRKYFRWSRNPCSSQNMAKVNSHNTGKVWEKTNISKLWVFQIFRVKQKSIPFPKHGKMNSHSEGKLW